ncbi:MAG: hypothetical protein JRJ87_10775 [Deltaproteobacteria bacterium]|nr:hypothetical protein [Deltaproteobacteria bacterium]
MQTLIQKYFWTLNLVFIAAGAWLLAATLNIIYEHELRPTLEYSHPLEETIATPQLDKNFQRNQIVVDRNYFESALAKKNDPPKPPNPPPSSPGVLSQLRASLVGTIVASESDWSMAVIADLARSEVAVYRNRDTLLEEAVIVAIHSRVIILERQGRREYLTLDEDPKPRAPARQGLRNQLASLKWIRNKSANSWSLDKTEFKKILADPGRVISGVRIVPAFIQGKTSGFKLFSIRPGSLFGQLGFRNGDIVNKVDGYSLNSPEIAFELFQKLKTARLVEINLTRRGKSFMHSYKIE